MFTEARKPTAGPINFVPHQMANKWRKRELLFAAVVICLLASLLVLSISAIVKMVKTFNACMCFKLIT